MTLGECIHGLEVPLCDICFPRRAPEPVRAPATRVRRERAATAPRSSGSRASGSRATGARAAATRTVASVDVAAHRVQHVTPWVDAEAIIVEGVLRADATPPLDLSSPTTRELRATTEVPGGGTAADRVPFYLTPDANRWLQLRAGALGPAWSDAARAVRPSELVAFVTGIGDLGDAVLADGDAAATTTRFVPVEDASAARSMLGRLLADGRIDDAEVLGPPELPLERIGLVVVAHEPMRDRVRAALEEHGRRIRVAVNPPWFAVP